MSRVNVDVKAFSDIRFQKLGAKVGLDKYSVRARFEEVWLHCTLQETYYISKEDFEALIPIDGFCEAAQSVFLLKPFRKTFYVSGTKGRIEWYGKLKKLSKLGGEANRKKHKQKQLVELKPSGYPPEHPTVEPSGNIRTDSPLSLTLSPSLVQKKSIARTPDGDPPSNSVSADENQKTETTQAWEHYAEKLQSDHDIKASRGAKEMSLVKKLVREFGLESTKNMINSFLDDTDRFVVDQAYQIGLLYSQRQKYSARAKESNVEDFGWEAQQRSIAEYRAQHAAQGGKFCKISGAPLIDVVFQ